MKLMRIIGPLCFAAGVLVGAHAASAANAEDLRLREHIANFVREHTRAEVTRLEVPSLARFAVDSPSDEVRVELESAGRSSRPNRMPVAISLWDARAHRMLKRGIVNIDVHGEQQVVVANKALRPGQKLTREDLRIETHALSEVDSDSVSDARTLIGQRLRRAVGRGTPLQNGFVERPPLIERGQRVKILVASGSLRIEMMGRAEQEGHAGDWIRATNDRSSRNVVGRVGEDGVLHVDL